MISKSSLFKALFAVLIVMPVATTYSWSDADQAKADQDYADWAAKFAPQIEEHYRSEYAKNYKGSLTEEKIKQIKCASEIYMRDNKQAWACYDALRVEMEYNKLLKDNNLFQNPDEVESHSPNNDTKIRYIKCAAVERLKEPRLSTCLLATLLKNNSSEKDVNEMFNRDILPSSEYVEERVARFEKYMDVYPELNAYSLSDFYQHQ